MTRLAIIFSFLFATPAWAEMVLYCQDELHTGIIKENGRWRTGDFTLDRYTVKFDEKKMTLGGLDQIPDILPDNSLVMKDSPLKCKMLFEGKLDDLGIKGYEDDVHCAAEFGDHIFQFNRKTLRYSFYTTSIFSYVRNSSGTANMSHGTCQKF